MNTRNPLAAALLLIAASVSAQPFAPGAGTSYSFSGANTGPFSLAASGAPGEIDMVEKCSTVPYRLCTAEELKMREIRKAGGCAEKDLICQRRQLENIGSAPLQLLGNQANSSTANDEFFKKCGTVPYRLCTDQEQKDRDAWLKGTATEKKPDGNSYSFKNPPGFIGPPSPNRNQGPQPFTDENSFKQAMQEQENLTPGKVVDLGNNTYAVDTGGGNYSIGGLCNGAPCSGLPKPADQIPGLADALQTANSLNNGDSINKENPGGFTPTSNKQDPPAAPGGGGGRQTPPPPADGRVAANDEARGSGNDAGDFFKSGGGAAGMGADGSQGRGFAAAAANGKEEAIATQAAELDGVFTYIKTQEIKASIDKTASAVAGGGDGTFVTPATTPDANAGDLQFKGTQSGANR